MTDDEILAALDFQPRLCKDCLLPAVVEFSWGTPCDHVAHVTVCDGHSAVFFARATVPQQWTCDCGDWAVYRLDDCLQVAAVTR